MSALCFKRCFKTPFKPSSSLLTALALLPVGAMAQGSGLALSAGFGLHPLGSAGPIVQAEWGFRPHITLALRFTRLVYSYEEDSYSEDGDGSRESELGSYAAVMLRLGWQF